MAVEGTMTAIEMMGTIDEHRQLLLDGSLPIPGPARVRVLILYPLSDEWDEVEWLQAATRNPAFGSLSDLEEGLYTLADGEPFHVTTMSQTTPFNLTGHPVVVLPAARSREGLPDGVQVVGRRWGEMKLLAIAKQLAEVVGPLHRPPGY